jgi:hypothetical protein
MINRKGPKSKKDFENDAEFQAVLKQLAEEEENNMEAKYRDYNGNEIKHGCTVKFSGGQDTYTALHENQAAGLDYEPSDNVTVILHAKYPTIQPQKISKMSVHPSQLVVLNNYPHIVKDREFKSKRKRNRVNQLRRYHKVIKRKNDDIAYYKDLYLSLKMMTLNGLKPKLITICFLIGGLVGYLLG